MFSFGILLDGLRVLGQGLPVFFRICAVSMLAIMLVGAVAVLAALGPSAIGSTLDPRATIAAMSRAQLTALMAGSIAVVVLLSYAGAATVHAAAAVDAGTPIGVREAFGRVRPKTLQLFWMQAAVSILALRFSPWAGVLLALFVLPSIPAAVLENLGPSEALDRAWALSRGHRMRLLAIEAGLALPVLLIAAGAGLMAIRGPLAQLSPAARAALALPIGIVLLIPLQYLLVTLTLAFRRLAAQPGLHARGAAGVN